MEVAIGLFEPDADLFQELLYLGFDIVGSPGDEVVQNVFDSFTQVLRLLIQEGCGQKAGGQVGVGDGVTARIVIPEVPVGGEPVPETRYDLSRTDPGLILAIQV